MSFNMKMNFYQQNTQLLINNRNNTNNVNSRNNSNKTNNGNNVKFNEIRSFSLSNNNNKRMCAKLMLQGDSTCNSCGSKRM